MVRPFQLVHPAEVLGLSQTEVPFDLLWVTSQRLRLRFGDENVLHGILITAMDTNLAPQDSPQFLVDRELAIS